MAPIDSTTNTLYDEKIRYLRRYYQEDTSTWENTNKAIETDKIAQEEEEENKYDAQEVMLEKLQRIAMEKMPDGKIRHGYPMTLKRRELRGAYSRKSQRPRKFRQRRIF